MEAKQKVLLGAALVTTGCGPDAAAGSLAERRGELEVACLDPTEAYDPVADNCLPPVPCDQDARPFGGGDGVTTPYSICAIDHLQNVDTEPNARFRLADSLNLTDVPGFGLMHFYGEFDGGGHVLVGLVGDSSAGEPGPRADYVGLFHQLTDATVENLVLRDFAVRGGHYVGALAGRATYSSIANVHVDGGSVEGEGAYVGGLLGRADDTFVRFVSVSATVSGDSAVGGLAGFAYAGLFERCRARAAVTATTQAAGGLVGKTAEHVLKECAARGAVFAPTHAGGLVGHMTGDDAVVRSFASGDVDGARNVGGLVGLINGYSGAIEASYATGIVSASDTDVGGLVGRIDLAVTDEDSSVFECYSSGRVDWLGPDAPPSSAGALLGSSNTATLRSFAIEQEPALPLIGQLESGGTSVESELLSERAFSSRRSFPNWDFDADWKMSRRLRRPILRWQLGP